MVFASRTSARCRMAQWLPRELALRTDRSAYYLVPCPSHEACSLVPSRSAPSPLAGACKRDEKSKAAGASSSSPSGESAPATGACIETVDLLVPFQKYGDNDMVRSIAIDGDQVYFRNYTEMFQVPLAGGAPRSLGKMGGSISESPMWIQGDRLISQSPGEPIFVAFPKAGGALSTILDMSKEKLGGGRSITTRLLSGIGKASAAHAGPAVFDGTSFFWIEDSKVGTSYSWAIKRVPLAGGPSCLSTSRKASSRPSRRWAIGWSSSAMSRSLPARNPPVPRRAGFSILGLNPSDKSSLMSLPIAGGAAEVRAARFDGQSIVADGSSIYVSGYQDGSLKKPGVYKITAAGAASFEKVFPFHVGQARGFFAGGNVIVAGHSPLAETKPGNLPDIARVFLQARGGGKLERFACIGTGYTLHAYRLAGKTLLVSVFREADRLAAIARIKVP